MSILDTIANLGNIGGLKRRTAWSRWVTPYVRTAKKTVLGPFRKFNPNRQLKNFNQRIMRKVGYYSTPMKAIRYGKRHGLGAMVQIFALRKLMGRK